MKPPLKMLQVLGMLAVAIASQAQEYDEPFKRFALLAGVNTSNINFNKGFFPPAVPIKASWKTGFTIGAMVLIPLTGKLFLQPEYYYTQRKGADNSIGTDYAIDYVSLPLLVSYNITPAVSIVAGPQAELLIRAKQSKGGIDTTITHDMEERSIGVTGGFDFIIKDNFIVSARYMHGLNHIGIRRQNYEREFKYEVVRLTAGVRF